MHYYFYIFLSMVVLVTACSANDDDHTPQDKVRNSPINKILTSVKPQRFLSLTTLSSVMSLTNVRKDVSPLLRECEKHFAANRLTSGKGGTAFACYTAVLEKDPTNAAALAGLKKIEDRYVTWIKRTLDRGQQNQAKRYLASLNKVNPKSPTTLAELEAWLQSPRSTPNPQVSWARHTVTPGQILRDRLPDGNFGPEMVWVPAGRFRMGEILGGGHDDKQPVRWVSIEGFAMGRYEVTFAEYDHFAEVTDRKKPADNGWERGNHPVIHVSWEDATAYTEWLTQQTGRHYRLPTEAEWEYAARAGTRTHYWWGNKMGTRRANCAGSGSTWSNQKTAPVGSFAPNPFDLYDTAGNVWEWTCSRHEKTYRGAERGCAKKEDSGERQLRGGSWFFHPELCRNAIRNWAPRDSVYNNVGFRVVAVSVGPTQ